MQDNKKRNAKLGGSSNVFSVGNSQQAQRQDRSYYKSLYSFNANQELAEYTLPVLSNQIAGKTAPGVVNATQLAPINQPGNQSAIQEEMEDQFDYDMDGNPVPRAPHVRQYGADDYDDEEEDEAATNDQSEDALKYEDFRNIIETTEGQTNNQTAELRKANFIRKNTPIWHMVQAIKTGDQAISFFAKHGTNMPIKFLNCNRKKVSASQFRPYDLVIIEDEKALEKEYFTISAQGVVQVFNEKRRKKGVNSITPTEFLSLSDWMQQSTMFNVLTSMKFFKHYLIGKVFGLWKGNVRYRTYQKTRQQLAKSLIQARPDFQPTYMDINKILYDMQVKQTYFISRMPKTYEIDDFINDQKRHRDEIKTHYNEKVEDIINKKLTHLVTQVTESRTISDQEDLENTKIGQAAKNKSMVLMKIEDELRNRVLKLAKLNYNHLGTFIRLIDYMVVETQVRINQESADMILSEMDNDLKKYSIQTTVGFENNNMDDQGLGLQFQPTKIEFQNHFEKLLADMQTVTEEVQRVINHQDFHHFIHGLITDSGPRFRTIVDESFKYSQVRKTIQERMAQDFAWIEDKSKNFKHCRDVNEFDLTFNFETFKEEHEDLESIRSQFERLQKWDININKYIKPQEMKGLLHANGRKLKEKLQNRVKKEQDNLRTFLFELASKNEKEINFGLNSIKTTLTKQITNLSSFVEFVNKCS